MKQIQTAEELSAIIRNHFSANELNVEIEKAKLITCHDQVVKVDLKMVYGDHPIEITLILNGDKEPIPTKYQGNLTYSALSTFIVELGTLIQRL